MPRYLYPLLIIGAFFLLSVVLRTAAAAARPEHRFGNLAQALGIAVTEGDPGYNLVIGADGFFLFRLFGVTKYDVKLRAAGMAGPYGLALAIDESVSRIKLRRVVIRDDHVYPDEGHGFARPENRKSFNAITEVFLAQVLGGRAQSIASDLEGATLEVPIGAGFVPGLEPALGARSGEISPQAP